MLEPSVAKTQEDLIKFALSANTALQDIDPERIDHGDKLLKAKTAIRMFREKLEEVENSTRLVDKETERMGLEKVVGEQRKELTSLNGRLRTINFMIQNAAEKRNKAALLGDQDVQVLRKRIKDKQSAAKGNCEITDSLLRTSRLMEEHLQRSNDTIETLANSSKGIISTGEELKSMQGHIKSSHSLLTKYGRKELTDKIFIFLAMVFFLATVLYIIKKRLWSSSYADIGANPPQHSTGTIEL